MGIHTEMKFTLSALFDALAIIGRKAVGYLPASIIPLLAMKETEREAVSLAF